MKGTKSISRFDLLHVDIQVSQHHLLKKTVFAVLHCLFSFVTDQLAIFTWVYFWTVVFSCTGSSGFFFKVNFIINVLLSTG